VEPCSGLVFSSSLWARAGLETPMMAATDRLKVAKELRIRFMQCSLV
jgi:hypothetical protein